MKFCVVIMDGASGWPLPDRGNQTCLELADTPNLNNMARSSYAGMALTVPPGMEPGLSVSHIMPVPTGGALPTADGRVQMYPCFSFEFHLVLIAIDPDLGKPQIKRYVVGHDCGTVINPKIVRGMTIGGIAHGIGAALYEEFAYSSDGLLMTQSFMDYLLPSSHEVPPVEIVHHETPSPHTVFGQKGSGESGYLGAPAAVASAVNDAVRPLGIVVNSLPIKVARLGDMIAEAREAPV